VRQGDAGCSFSPEVATACEYESRRKSKGGSFLIGPRHLRQNPADVLTAPLCEAVGAAEVLDHGQIRIDAGQH